MLDALPTYLLLCLAAFGAGIVNTLAGGGTLLTFPALTSVLGMVEANVTSTVALVPGSFAGAWGLRKELGDARPWLLLLLGPSIFGGLTGAILLTRLPGSYFANVVPWLLLLAALLFLFQPHLARWLVTGDQIGLPAPWLCGVVMVFQFLVGVYGGYFGAGIGILMISSLSLMGLGEIHRINAVKNLLAAAINGVSIVVFVFSGGIAWHYAGAMAAAAILGGLSGARLGRVLPRWLLRWLVIAIGFGLAAYFFWKQTTVPANP